MFQSPFERGTSPALRSGASLRMKYELMLREVWSGCRRTRRSDKGEWGIVMRGLIAVIIFLPVVLGSTLCAAPDTGRDSYLSYSDFIGLFPGAAGNIRRDGACVLMQRNGCRIIAVVCSERQTHIPLIFVNAETADKASGMARRITERIRCRYAVRPFEKREPWVVIICPCLSKSQKYTPNVLCSPNVFLFPGSAEKVRFIGWQGKSLRVRVDYEPELSQRRKAGTIEIVSDISRYNCSCVEFRLTKGNFSNDEMLEFVCERMSSVSSYISVKNGSRLRELKKRFPGYNILSYAHGADACVIRKRKICLVGSADAVAAYISPHRPIANFEFPANEIRDETGTETEEQPQNNEKNLASEQQVPAEVTKTPETREGKDNGDGKSLPPSPPSTVPEAINRYIRYLDTL